MNKETFYGCKQLNTSEKGRGEITLKDIHAAKKQNITRNKVQQ